MTTLRPYAVLDGLVYVQLTMGKVAVLDEEDESLASLNWCAHKHHKCFYARRAGDVKLHREVAKRMGLEIDGREVDHIDGDGLNCRRSNLRVATPNQNQHNRGRQANNRSGIKGVGWSARAGKWRARIGMNGRSILLGFFSSAEEAGAAYRAAAVELHGDFARFE